MKENGIAKAMAKVAGKGRAAEALSELPDGGMPADIPAAAEAPELPELPDMPELPDVTPPMMPPETIPPVEAMGPPDFDPETGLPDVSMGRPPEFDEETGLPLIAIENMAAAGAEDEDEDDDDMMELSVI